MSTEKMETESPKPYVPGPSVLDISPNQDKGVLKEILVEGTGDERPSRGQKVSVHYVGRLTDGTQFDSSVDRGELFGFILGKGEVIKGWDVGVATMRKGEKCVLTCHHDYAYGAKGSPPKIPENSTLIFEVELFSWEMEDISPNNDKGILRSNILSGEGFVKPDDGAIVEIHLVGKCGGVQFDEREVKFQLGEGSDVGIVDGVETALKQFTMGEKSKITLSPKYAFGTEGSKEFNIPPNSTVEYEITLKSFENEKEVWSMSPEEKLEQSEIVKEKGTRFFKDGKFQQASKQYQKIINYLREDSDMEDDRKEKKNSLLCAGYLNLAACFLKLENFDEVIQNCDKALEIETKNAKGLFRKGQAYLSLKDYEKAKECFNLVLEIDSSNKAAQKNIYICKTNMKQQLEKEKKMYQTMFKKMAEQDPEPDSTSVDKHQENGLADKMESETEKPVAAEGVAV